MNKTIRKTTCVREYFKVRVLGSATKKKTKKTIPSILYVCFSPMKSKLAVCISAASRTMSLGELLLDNIIRKFTPNLTKKQFCDLKIPA